ncbi:MAG: hypothetical protein OEZ48_02715 [Candidatus Bathyarchaeota archaeon]|nr:hypothetical protein [Candidatus Bathyarchaeota archaeon]
MDDSLRRRKKILDYLSDLDYALEPLYRIDFDKLRNISKILRNLEHEISQYRFSMDRSMDISGKKGYYRNVDLVGLLPVMLMSKEVFPTHNTLYDFSIEVLGIDLRHKLGTIRPARTRIVGEILAEVVRLPKKNLDRVLERLQLIIRNRAVHKKQDFFVDWDSTIRRMRSEHAASEI